MAKEDQDIDLDSMTDRVQTRMQNMAKENPCSSAVESFHRLCEVMWSEVSAANVLIGAGEKELLHSFFFDSDRGCVLVASSIIDKKLEKLIGDFFKSKSNITKTEIAFFFEGKQPLLQSTSIKIRLAFALGIIADDLKKSLEVLQTLRSRVAAHNTRPMKLTTEDCIRIVKPLNKDTRDIIKSHMQSNAFALLSRGFGQPVSLGKAAFVLVAYFFITTLKSNQSTGSDK
jgi:DNA-binding MltR family transcriptional regulator